MRTTLAVLALSLSLTTTLAGCGDSGDDEIRSGGTDATSSSAPETSATDRPDEVEVCDLATEADVEAAFDEDVPAGSFSSGGTDSNGVQWQSDNCNWRVEDGLEVKLEYSTAEDFADGELLCPELDSFDTPSTPVDGLDAESAAWVNDQVDPDEGTLRVCTETALINIDVEYPDGAADPAAMQERSVALAEVVLAHLG